MDDKLETDAFCVAAGSAGDDRPRRRSKGSRSNHAAVSARDAEDRDRTAFNAPDFRAAISQYELAQARRDSVCRKLTGGSDVVTVADLARCEGWLADAKKVLVGLAQQTPTLKRHPVVAAAFAAGN